MAKVKETGTAKLLTASKYKKTNQGGVNPKRSSMNKDQKRSYKTYRGQGK